MLHTIGLGGGRLEASPDRSLDAQSGQPDHVRERPRTHTLGSPGSVTGALQDQPLDELGPLYGQLLGDETPSEVPRTWALLTFRCSRTATTSEARPETPSLRSRSPL